MKTGRNAVAEAIRQRVAALIESGLTPEQAAARVAKENTEAYQAEMERRANIRRANSKKYR